MVSLARNPILIHPVRALILSALLDPNVAVHNQHATCLDCREVLAAVLERLMSGPPADARECAEGIRFRGRDRLWLPHAASDFGRRVRGLRRGLRLARGRDELDRVGLPLEGNRAAGDQDDGPG